MSAASLRARHTAGAGNEPKRSAGPSPSTFKEKQPLFSFTGFAGTSGKSFFRAPGWVDTSLPPGATSQDSAYCPAPHWWVQAYSGYSLFFSPNLVWLGIALAVYAIAPYDLEAAKSGFAPGWMLWRAAVNVVVTFGYFGFWHLSLYWFGFGKRPFKADREWRWGKVLHNMWYTLLGALQWTGWEVL